MLEKCKETANYIKNIFGYTPEIGIVLGSGLGDFAFSMEIEHTIPYEKLNGFPASTVEGHNGNLLLGSIGNKKIAVLQGRFHYYEGYNMDEICFAVRTLYFLGIKYFFVSNASGGLNPDFKPGDLMIINDHINFFPEHPLRGKNYDELGPRFPDMSKVYDKKLIEKAKAIAFENNIELKEGIYIGSSGPSLETPAEYKMFRIWGADATGMSTVPEVIVAHHAGIKCFGISVVTNGSTPLTPGGETTHDEVQENAQKAEPSLALIFSKLIENL